MADYELRALQATDIFPMVKILNKIGFKKIKEYLSPEKIKEFTSFIADSSAVDPEGSEQPEDGSEVVAADPDRNLEQAVTMVGFTFVMDVAGLVLENLPSCENEIYSFLASVANMKAQDIRTIGMADFANMIVDILQKEEFKDFFKAVSRLLK